MSIYQGGYFAIEECPSKDELIRAFSEQRPVTLTVYHSGGELEKIQVVLDAIGHSRNGRGGLLFGGRVPGRETWRAVGELCKGKKPFAGSMLIRNSDVCIAFRYPCD